jgi:uncharacterized membrane protein YedE/YeeE
MSKMPSIRREAYVGLLSGLVFAGGLVLSGMTDPSRVLAFLDFAGDWDPRLIWVMVGAIGVHFSWLRIAAHWQGAEALAYSLPPTAKLDRPLLVGAALFGIGWGLAGYCPGPAVVAAGGGVASAAIFTAAMLGGMWLFKVSSEGASPALRPARPPEEEAAPN